MSKPGASSVSLKRLIITPPIQRLAFGFDCPEEWKQVEIPTDTPDFSDFGAFMPLGVFMAPYAAILYSVAARPAYEGGSVYEWAQQLLAHHQFQITGLMPGKVNNVDAIRASAIQPTDAGPMQVAVAFFEDGGSIVHVTAMAPQPLWGSVEAMFEKMIDSFALIQPQGATVPLIPGQQPPKRETTFGQLALAEDATTLTDPEQKLNAYLRDNGIGLLPRVMTMHEEERYAVMACGSIMAGVPVPFGWHLFDDGKRTLVFTGDNAIQINLSMVATEGMTVDQGMDSIIKGMLKEQPQAEYHKLEIEGLPVLAFKGLNINGEALSQVFIFKQLAKREGTIFQARVTASEADLYRAMDLAGLMVQKMKFFE